MQVNSPYMKYLKHVCRCGDWYIDIYICKSIYIYMYTDAKVNAYIYICKYYISKSSPESQTF